MMVRPAESVPVTKNSDDAEVVEEGAEEDAEAVTVEVERTAEVVDDGSALEVVEGVVVVVTVVRDDDSEFSVVVDDGVTVVMTVEVSRAEVVDDC